METYRRIALPLFLLLVILVGIPPAWGVLTVQCPEDQDGDGIPAADIYGNPLDPDDTDLPNVKCMHLSSGDGYIRMADGTPIYMFGFSDVTSIPEAAVMTEGPLSHQFSAPLIMLDEGDEFYLTLSNVGMAIRPDLFDPHTVHYHGLPQSSNIYDGLPESGIAIKMGASLTYYYKINDPGTYMYHCHVEATEHMQMGMLGSLYVRPAQSGPITYNGRTYTKFAYNDGDGSTGFHVEKAIQLGGFDVEFHNRSGSTQPLPFALMRAHYPMLNGRGYPDTVAAAGPVAPAAANPITGNTTQPINALVTALPGQSVLLRLSNLEVTRYFTLASPGFPMRVVGKDAKQLRGPDPDGDGPLLGKNLSYTTNSLTFGGGQSYDVILDIPSDAAPGRYFLYATDLNFLVNHKETSDGMGGMLTEIRIQ